MTFSNSDEHQPTERHSINDEILFIFKLNSTLLYLLYSTKATKRSIAFIYFYLFFVLFLQHK
jgi:hypothetical protein